MVDTLDVPVVNISEKLENDIVENIEKEIQEITEKIETLQPNDEFVETLLTAESDKSEELIETEIKKIDEIQNEIKSKIDEIIENNPEVSSLLKKTNTHFTNFWNGVEY